MRNTGNSTDSRPAIKRVLLAATLVAALALSAPFATGCAKKASTNPDISAGSFRADPSKMTPAEKQKMESMMRGAGRPPAK
jgi:hypothetical protein